MIFTHGRDGEGADAVLCEVLGLFEGDLHIAIGRGAIGGPVLLTLFLCGERGGEGGRRTTRQ